MLYTHNDSQYEFQTHTRTYQKKRIKPIKVVQNLNPMECNSFCKDTRFVCVYACLMCVCALNIHFNFSYFSSLGGTVGENVLVRKKHNRNSKACLKQMSNRKPMDECVCVCARSYAVKLNVQNHDFFTLFHVQVLLCFTTMSP